MHVLILDTSTDYAIVGVCDEHGGVISSQIARHERQLSVRLYSMIEQALGDAGIGRKQIDALSVGLGPGSFTGVRVAVTTMRTLAQVLAKPLYAFGTLEAITQTVRLEHLNEDEKSVLAVLPSRRDEVYAQWFDSNDSPGKPVAASYDEVQGFFEELPGELIAAGPKPLLETILPSVSPSRLIDIEHGSIDAMAYLAAKAIAANQTRDPLSLDPMYVAPPAVSQHKQGKR